MFAYSRNYTLTSRIAIDSREELSKLQEPEEPFIVDTNQLLKESSREEEYSRTEEGIHAKKNEALTI